MTRADVIKYRQLINEAEYVPSCEGVEHLSVDELCKRMVSVAQKGVPVKSDWEGQTFVIDSNMPIELALK